MKGSRWFEDHITPDMVQLHRVIETVYSGRTQFQSVEVIESGAFSRCLVLDGKIQSSETDEFIYHEALVQPAMTTHPNPETVFIAGGGEGATLREVLRHPSVKKVVMVDSLPYSEYGKVLKAELKSWYLQGTRDAFRD